MDIPLDEVVYVEGIASASTGAAADADSTPTFAVYEEATDTDVGVGGNLTKRTSLTGNYRGSFTASAANGFEIGKWYTVVGSATIGGVACKGILKQFRIVAAEVVAGYPVIDIAKLLGTAWLAPAVAGTPDVNVIQLSGDATAADNAEAFFDGTGYAGTNNVIPQVTTTTNLTNAPTAGDLTATMKTSVTTAATAATPTVTAGTVSDKTGYNLSSAGIQAIWDVATTALITAGSIGKRIVDYLTGDSFTRLGTPAGASVSADIAAIKTDTGVIATDTTTDIPATVEVLRKLLRADHYVDTSVTPWALVYMEEGTGGIGVGTELFRKRLFNTSGVNLTSTDTVVGQAKV